jgi:hypothetical protein
LIAPTLVGPLANGGAGAGLEGAEGNDPAEPDAEEAGLPV